MYEYEIVSLNDYDALSAFVEDINRFAAAGYRVHTMSTDPDDVTVLLERERP